MVLELKLRKVGNSVGVVFPKEALAHLNAREGDALIFTGAREGGFRVTPSNADVTGQMAPAVNGS